MNSQSLLSHAHNLTGVGEIEKETSNSCVTGVPPYRSAVAKGVCVCVTRRNSSYRRTFQGDDRS
jgi:hypothetical protein